MEAATPTRPARGCLRLRWTAWPIYVLGMCILLVLLVYVWEVLAGLPLRSTGDPLFDSYAGAVRNRQVLRLYRGGGMHPATLPDSQLARWERRFGDDPRYWELRAFCAQYRDQRPIWIDAMNLDRRDEVTIPYLERAVELSGSVAAHWLLHDASRRQREEALDALLDEQRKRGGDDDAELVSALAANEASDLAELTAALEAHPEAAWAHYNLARWHFELGDWDAALPLLESGTAAADQTPPKLFPLSFITEQLAAGRVPGSSRVVGTILELENRDIPIRTMVRWKLIAQDLTLGVLMSGDLGLWLPYHRAACQMGRHARGDLVQAASAAIMLKPLPEALLTEGAPGLTNHEREELLRLLDSIDLVTTRVHRYGGEMAGKFPQVSLMQNKYTYADAGAGGQVEQPGLTENLRQVNWTLLPGKFYAASVPQALYQHDYCKSIIVPVFDQLEPDKYGVFDFETSP